MMNIVWGWIAGYTISTLAQAVYGVYVLRQAMFVMIGNFVSRVAITVHRLG